MRYLSAFALLLAFSAHAANLEEAQVRGRVAVQQKEAKTTGCTLAVIARTLRGDTHLWIAGSLSTDGTGVWMLKGAYFEVPRVNTASGGVTIKSIKSFSMQAEGQPVLARTGYANIKTQDETIMYHTQAEPSAALMRAIFQQTPVRLSILDAQGTTEVFRGVAQVSPGDHKKMAECMADLNARAGSNAQAAQ